MIEQSNSDLEPILSDNILNYDECFRHVILSSDEKFIENIQLNKTHVLI